MSGHQTAQSQRRRFQVGRRTLGAGFKAVAVTAVVAVVASGCGASVAASVDPFDISTDANWDPQTLAPLGVTTTGGGAQAPSYPNSVVTEKQGLAVSLQPTLQATSIPKGQEYDFTISTIGSKSPQQIWQQGAPTNQIKVPAGVLKQGGVYQWQARSVAKNQIFGPFIMNVDAVRASAQPHQAVGPVNVAQASGQASIGISPRAASSVSGDLGVALTFSAGDPGDPGLPAGWQMHAQGKGWDYIQTYGNGTIDLVTGTGKSDAYTVNSDGVSYSPVLPAGLLEATGSSPTVAKNSDGTWTVTASSGMVWTFAAANSDGVAYLTGSFNGVLPGPVYDVSNGRIDSVKDSVSQSLEVDMQYQGSGNCPSVPDGFVDPANGMLCAITYPDGSTMGFYYVADSAGNQYLARSVDYVGAQEGKASVTDFGYDASGRIVSVREPIAANAQASGVRSDTSALLTTVAYDSAGRVQSVTKPAAQSGQLQPTVSFVYEPNLGITEMRSNGPTTPGGYDARLTYDTNRLNPLTTVDGFGGKVSDTWVAGTDLKDTSTNEWGYSTKKTYDDQQRVQSTIGPYLGAKPGKGTQTSTYQYDQQFLGNQASDLHGFNVTYWNNADLTGSPVSRSFGPEFNGNVPLQTSWTWPASPTGGDTQPWSARLTGTVTTTAPGTGNKTPVYGFSSGPNGAAKLWVDNIACPTPRCSIPLTAGEHQVRIDLAEPTPGANGSAGLAVNWQPPNTSALTPIPITSIRPGYGVNSVVTNNGEALSADTSYQASSFVDYADPASGNQTAAWVQQAPEAKGQASYEPFNPDQEQFGRSLNDTAPAGNATNYTYYGTNEEASVPCANMGSINQYGRPKQTLRSIAPGGSEPSQTYTAYHGTMGELVAAATNDGDADCYYYDDTGATTEMTTPARGDVSPASTQKFLKNVDGNPLKGSVVISSGDQKYVTTAEVDLYGHVISSSETFYKDAGNPTSTNSWGSTSTATYDPFTGKPLTNQVTLSSGKSTTTTYTYYPQGQIKNIQVDGTTVVSAGLMTARGINYTYGNGVTLSTVLNGSTTSGTQTWASTDKQQFIHSASTSPTTRLLEESYQFGSSASTAAMGYTYDKRGRLAAAALTTNLNVSHKSWQYGFDTATLGTNANAGLNTNRTQQVVDGVATNYGYNGVDQLTNTSDAVIGNTVNYSGWGEITNLGPLTIDYDANSQVSKIVDSAAGETVTYNRVGGNVQEKTVQTSSGTTVNRYAGGGFILDSNNNPQWQGIQLPGNVTLLRDMSGNQRWQHQTSRGQLMWVSDQNGHDTGERHLYSPFGEELISASATSPASTAPAPAPASTSASASSKQSAAPSSSGSAATTSPKEAAAAPPPSKSATAPALGDSSSPPARSKSATAPAPSGSSASPNGSASPSGSSSPGVQEPDLGWMAGQGQESQQIGSVTVIDMGSRLYVPTLGRFTSPDPVVGGSVNAYDYVNQDPVNQRDASGNLPSWFEDLMITVAVTVVVSIATGGLADGLEAAGLTADFAASNAAGRAVYTAVNTGIPAITQLGSVALENKIMYGEVSPGGWSNKPVLWEEAALTTLTIYGAMYSASARLTAATLQRSLSKQASSLMASVTQMNTNANAAITAAAALGAQKADQLATAVTNAGTAAAASVQAASAAATSTAAKVADAVIGVGICGRAGRALGTIGGSAVGGAYSGGSMLGVTAGGAAGHAVGGTIGDALDNAGSWLMKLIW